MKIQNLLQNYSDTLNKNDSVWRSKQNKNDWINLLVFGFCPKSGFILINLLARGKTSVQKICGIIDHILWIVEKTSRLRKTTIRCSTKIHLTVPLSLYLQNCCIQYYTLLSFHFMLQICVSVIFFYIIKSGWLILHTSKFFQIMKVSVNSCFSVKSNLLPIFFLIVSGGHHEFPQHVMAGTTSHTGVLLEDILVERT